MIPDDVRRFILARIPSVPHLEAALLMHSQPGQERTAAEVAARLYVPERQATELLAALCACDVLTCTDPPTARYRYRPGDASLDSVMGALARTYAEDLVGVTQLIHDATRKSAHRFADAFRLRKEK